MKQIVLVNVDFRDACTGELRVAGSRAELTEERITAIKAVNPDFVTVIGIVEEPAEAENEPKTATKKKS